MSKTIPLPKVFFEKILKPVNKLTESCVLKIKNTNLYTICSSEDKSVILYANLNLPITLDEEVRLNIISIKRLISGLDCLGNDGIFNLTIDNNHIKCETTINNNQKLHFKYHLVDDTIIQECPVKIEKLSTLKFDTEFILTAEKAKRILAASTFASDASKVYFKMIDDNIIQADIDDKTLQNIDNISIPLADKYIGEPITESFPISLEIFKNLSSIKSDIKVKINNQNKVIIFNISESDSLELKYIVSALIK